MDRHLRRTRPDPALNPLARAERPQNLNRRAAEDTEIRRDLQGLVVRRTSPLTPKHGPPQSLLSQISAASAARRLVPLISSARHWAGGLSAGAPGVDAETARRECGVGNADPQKGQVFPQVRTLKHRP